MREVERSALVGHPPERMYELVRDVDSYPLFLSWCSGARVISDDGSEQLASIEVRLAGIHLRFSTRNRLSPPNRIQLSLEEGPFKTLAGHWDFKAVGDSGCRVGLTLRFEVASRLLAVAFERSFAKVADRLVDDFCKRADKVYG